MGHVVEKLKFFISYCHEDEWLKNELKSHLAGLSLERNIVIWDDRKLVVGEPLDETIMSNLYSADVAIMLVSSDFINSRYCMTREYKEAKRLRDRGEMEMAAVVVRHCNWAVNGLNDLVCLPTDGRPVNGDGYDQSQKTKRDKAWLDVVTGLGELVSKMEILRSPILRTKQFSDKVRKGISLKHPDKPSISLNEIFIDNDIRVNGENEYIETQENFLDFLYANPFTFVSGDDACGKTTLFHQTQKSFLHDGVPAVIINGREIQNLQVDRKIRSAISYQLEPREYKNGQTWIIIDDFENCNLPDSVKNQLLDNLASQFAGIVVSTYTSFQSMQTIEANGNLASSVEIVPLSPSKTYRLVEKWVRLSELIDEEEIENNTKIKFQLLSQLIHNGGIPTHPSYLLNFLEVMETTAATDIKATANASCYDALIKSRLFSLGIKSGDVDQYYLFSCYVAYTSYQESARNTFDDETLKKALIAFTKEYFDPPSDFLDRMLQSSIISVIDNEYSFSVEFIWYFFIGRYVSKELYRHDRIKFDQEISNCIEKIHQRLYANIILFTSYFLEDDKLVSALVECLDSKFGDVSEWELNVQSEKSINLSNEILKLTQKDSGAKEERIRALQQENKDIIQNSEKVVESYLHPFSITSSKIDDIEETESFMGQVNSLFRIQSILSQAFSTRSGTFSRTTVYTVVDSMVRAAGRFSRLNLSVADQILADPDAWILGVRDAFPNDDLSTIERSEKLLKIFSFWSVVLAQGGVARLLQEPHAIAALKLLHKDYELNSAGEISDDKGFNYSSILCISELWATGKIDKPKLENMVKQYGKNSPFAEILRYSLFVFSHYHSVDTSTRQWLSSSMDISLKSTRFVQRKLPVPTMDNRERRKRIAQKQKGKKP